MNTRHAHAPGHFAVEVGMRWLTLILFMDAEIPLHAYAALMQRELLRIKLKMSFDKDKVNFKKSLLMNISSGTADIQHLQLHAVTAGIVAPSLYGAIADLSIPRLIS